MPICPHCGDEFPKGGAFASHVRNCSQNRESQDEEGIIGRLDHLEARVNRVEEAATQSVDRDSHRVTDRRAQEAMSMAEDADSRSRRAKETADEVKKVERAVTVNCSECGSMI